MAGLGRGLFIQVVIVVIVIMCIRYQFGLYPVVIIVQSTMMTQFEAIRHQRLPVCFGKMIHTWLS